MSSDTGGRDLMTARTRHPPAFRGSITSRANSRTSDSCDGRQARDLVVILLHLDIKRLSSQTSYAGIKL